jgi:SAM-dependent methyltransferase
MTGPGPDDPWPPLAGRRARFDGIYTTEPERFAGSPSPFSGWALEVLRPRVATGRLLDLGCGLGRDARRFAAAGYEVRATDFSPVAIARAEAQPDRPPSLRFEVADAVTALRTERDEGLDGVYAHALYMLLSDRELEATFREVHRVLRPGGLHLFAVRSVTDPAAREGMEVAPDVRQRQTAPGAGPHPPPYRYFRAETLDRWTASGFERVATASPPGLHFWFVADRRPC